MGTIEQRVLSSEEIEFISEITQQITEEKFQEQCYETDPDDENGTIYSEEAQDFFNERYDEVETLYRKMIK